MTRSEARSPTNRGEWMLGTPEMQDKQLYLNKLCTNDRMESNYWALFGGSRKDTCFLILSTMVLNVLNCRVRLMNVPHDAQKLRAATSPTLLLSWKTLMVVEPLIGSDLHNSYKTVGSSGCECRSARLNWLHRMVRAFPSIMMESGRWETWCQNESKTWTWSASRFCDCFVSFLFGLVTKIPRTERTTMNSLQNPDNDEATILEPLCPHLPDKQ